MDKILYIAFFQVIIALLFLGLKNSLHPYYKYLQYFLLIGFFHLTSKLIIMEFATDPFISFQYFIPFSFGYAPSFFLFISEVLKKKNIDGRQQILHFSPLFVFLIFYLIFGIYYSLHGIHSAMIWYSRQGYYLIGVQIVVYSFLSLRLCMYGIREQGKDQYIFKHSLIISSLFLVLGLMVLIDMIKPSLVNYSFSSIIAYVALLTIFVLILHMLYQTRIIGVPAFYVERNVIINEGHYEKYQSSGLKQARKQEILSSINTFLTSNRPYLESDFNLASLSKTLGIPKHHISQVLNELEKKNFFQYINEYRVQAVCNELDSRKKENINMLEIAYLCGFKSKSAFNQNFKKITGKTPSTYLANKQ